MFTEDEHKPQENANPQRPQRPRIPGRMLEGNSSSAGRERSRDGEHPQRPFRQRYNAYGDDRRSGDRDMRGREGGYQPRARYNNNNEGGYQPRPRYNSNEGGYQPRPRYNNDEGGYQPRPRYNNNEEGGYQPRQRYNNNEEGGYQPRQRFGGDRANAGSYNSRPRFGGDREANSREGGYTPHPRYNRPYDRDANGRDGGHGQQGRGAYGQGRGGFRQHSADYNPHAKYSMKKQIEYKETHFDPDAPIRLNRFLANAGVCSRREADTFITAGVVSVNGEVVTELGTKVKRSDEVKFHDQPVSMEKKVYVLLNKPKDYVTTSDDPQNRKTVMDLVKNACRERIYPVGRLDRNTTGVLLFTNDGDLATKLTHPQYRKKKVYHVFLDKNVSVDDLHHIMDGIELEDGSIKADAVDYASDTDKKQVGIEIHSGRNRIVRRIFEHLGYKVIKLDRVLFAGLTKKNLRRGDWRFLTEQEVNMLRMGAFE